jgi:hypothetical protein
VALFRAALFMTARRISAAGIAAAGSPLVLARNGAQKFAPRRSSNRWRAATSTRTV